MHHIAVRSVAETINLEKDFSGAVVVRFHEPVGCNSHCLRNQMLVSSFDRTEYSLANELRVRVFLLERRVDCYTSKAVWDTRLRCKGGVRGAQWDL